ncbi:hypothetical protein VSR01_17400 [Actinacidiphila sp. DG2A-62]|uniref:hypothetical protein n=1 Tax=Actinacidiphila sp. DG2A-62 TaxID=3108821 RepID=UPI002DBEC25C|nr:hypothetical protein [Actinacidiphila sp. DG2A-62]MEC3995215.1 hypothetical protein [Actinacidiphila sp. DG2A-62]
MSGDDIVSSPPTYAPCVAVRITPYAGDEDEPDHQQAVTYRFDEPVMLAYVYRTHQPAVYESTGPFPYARAAPGLVAFAAPDDHPNRLVLPALAQGLWQRRGTWQAVDAWAKTPGGETLYLLVPRWKRLDVDEHKVDVLPGHSVLALGEAIPTTEARAWPRACDEPAEYHVEWGTSLFLSTDTSRPPAAGFPAPAQRTTV